MIGRNQAKWMSDWIGITDIKNNYNDQSGMALGTSKVVEVRYDSAAALLTRLEHTPAEPSVIKSAHVSSSRSVVVDRVPKVDESGYPIRDPETGSRLYQSVTAKAYYCPKCGSIVRNPKGNALGSRELSSEPKGATQKTCNARLLVAKHDPEKPKQGPDTIVIDTYRDAKGQNPLRTRVGDKKPGMEVNFLGRKWDVVECGEPLFHYTAAPYRWAPARIIQKKLRRFFNYLVIDEIHEHKSDAERPVDGMRQDHGRCSPRARPHRHDHRRLRRPPLPPDDADQRRQRSATRASSGARTPRSEVYGRIDRIVTVTGGDPETAVRGNVKSMRRCQERQRQRAEGRAAGRHAHPVRPAHDRRRPCSSRWRS